MLWATLHNMAKSLAYVPGCGDCLGAVAGFPPIDDQNANSSAAFPGSSVPGCGGCLAAVAPGPPLAAAGAPGGGRPDAAVAPPGSSSLGVSAVRPKAPGIDGRSEAVAIGGAPIEFQKASSSVAWFAACPCNYHSMLGQNFDSSTFPCIKDPFVAKPLQQAAR